MREEDTYSEIMRVRRNNQIVRRATDWVLPIILGSWLLISVILVIAIHFAFKYW
jgi:hypothetical protein